MSQCDRIVHRGPDDAGYFTDDNFGFGMRRLSIIDLPGGHQPIETAEGRYAVVFNGEIYNHPELRAELTAAGCRFRTQSDTETLLASFVHWQEDAWIRLEGMFAAAIWDRNTRTLTLARDPMGIKPLNFTQQLGSFAFASEIRALRVLPEYQFTLDERAANDYFSFGHVQKPRTIFREVESLAPGHRMQIRADGGTDTRAFWRPHFEIRTDLSENEWIEETRAQVKNTVKKHMLADVPVGAFLSGGVDSAAITAVMSQLSEGPVKAFTLGLPGSRLDETASAAAIAEHLGCEHIVLDLHPMEAAECLPAVQRAFDEPCAATAAVPIWHISRLAAEHVKVVLCGEGGDELFAGYKRQRTAKYMQAMNPLFRALGPIIRLLDFLPVTGNASWNYQRQNILRFRDSSLLGSGYQRFFRGTQISSPAQRERVYTADFKHSLTAGNEYDRLEAEYFGSETLQQLSPLQQFLLADLTIHMPGSLLNRLDRASMAHSLEARVPFLSHQFVDWTMTIPMNMKLRGKVGKYVLREAARPWLKPELLSAHKLGFQLPFAEWFAGDFADFAQQAWQGSHAVDSGFLDPEEVATVFDEHREGRADHGRMLFAITMFSCWWQDEFNSGLTNGGQSYLERAGAGC